MDPLRILTKTTKNKELSNKEHNVTGKRLEGHWKSLWLQNEKEPDVNKSGLM